MLEAINFYDYHKLGLMGWPLIVTSVIALTLVFERSVAAVQFSRKRVGLFAALEAEMRDLHAHGAALRDRVLGRRLEEVGGSLMRFVSSLNLIAAVTPLMGLIGTILGIIATFKVIAVQTDPITPALIADGLWEALLTTVVGLTIALPVLVFAHIYTAWAERQLAEMTQALNDVGVSLDRGEAAL